MKLLLAIVLASACSIAPDYPRRTAAVGDACDPMDWQTSCGPGLVCATDGTCGAPCGNGNVVCDPSTLCTQAADCIPPCLVDGQPQIRTITGVCESRGLITLSDGRCVIPCWYYLCTDVLGGSC